MAIEMGQSRRKFTQQNDAGGNALLEGKIRFGSAAWHYNRSYWRWWGVPRTTGRWIARLQVVSWWYINLAVIGKQGQTARKQ